VLHINFAFCLHSHQPPGNLPWVLEAACEKAYRPFLEVIQGHPEMKVVLHYSGALLSWLEAHRPELLDTVRRLVVEGQAEMMTGGLYEPILSIIPERDQLGQIAALTARLHKLFRADPQGMWLTERVWQPDLVRPLHRAGIRYTIVDDNNFQMAGIPGEQTLGHFTASGPGGESIEIFPINGFLRRAIPFQPPEAVIAHLRGIAGEGNRLALFADDGEKFGEWPGTHDWVYSQGWLEHFLRLLAENRDWVHLTTLAEFLQRVPPLGPVNLPTGSYAEMMEWSGGSWRNFLSRYSESNLMYHKMLRVSDQVAAMSASAEQREQARDQLYRGQANDAYWHGVFGGIYLLHLRTANWRSLLAAENIAAPGDGLHTECMDFDGDGQEEVLTTSRDMNAYLHRTGGQVFELDYRPIAWNLLATLTCRRERYHEQVENSGYDWYPRRGLIDHFLREDTSPDSFARCHYGEQGDFVNQPYALQTEHQTEAADVVFRRDGGAWVTGRFRPLRVTKRIGLAADLARLRVDYELEQREAEPLRLWFACESNFVLSSGSEPGRYYQIAASPGGAGSLAALALGVASSHRDVSRIALVDEWLGCRVQIEFARPTDLWVFPIETLSQGLEGWRRSYQGNCVTAHWQVELLPNQPWIISFVISLERLGSSAAGRVAGASL
jgi:alpha-amylase